MKVRFVNEWIDGTVCSDTATEPHRTEVDHNAGRRGRSNLDRCGGSSRAAASQRRFEDHLPQATPITC
jgi:hypothetical protein